MVCAGWGQGEKSAKRVMPRLTEIIKDAKLHRFVPVKNRHLDVSQVRTRMKLEHLK